jgi:hypothetical protein
MQQIATILHRDISRIMLRVTTCPAFNSAACQRMRRPRCNTATPAAHALRRHSVQSEVISNVHPRLCCLWCSHLHSRYLARPSSGAGVSTQCALTNKGHLHLRCPLHTACRLHMHADLQRHTASHLILHLPVEDAHVCAILAVVQPHAQQILCAGLQLRTEERVAVRAGVIVRRNLLCLSGVP